uniref:G6b-B extracellular V-set Ig-like domain-containing protein n=1 Tax=Chrysemys picta bellii TaxID=8478 RepID=A0A8C3FBN5_CHRPI
STMRPQLLPLALALLAAVPPGAQAEAGSNVNLSCNLMGPRLIWQWVPRYPICAGVSGGIETIYTATATGAHDTPEGRFKKRLHLLTSWGTQPSILQFPGGG